MLKLWLSVIVGVFTAIVVFLLIVRKINATIKEIGKMKK